ncbi:SelT/SelW/SelH family protein [Ammoniphilus sp. 3BR4]|uniref:SelT/SelW/SelH family protein n=1 Tax=Ammoniphilus sp. 3BR4 TaxID=3158265 RepID=UPI003467D041
MPKAVSLTEEILNELKNSVKEFSLIPSSDGVFELTLDNEIIFSKKELGRFPDEGEVMNTIRSKLE